MTEYDITEAFRAIENELIASMIRNMDRHRADETAEGIEWSMWQAEQLKALEKYKRENQKKYKKEFKRINKEIDALIRKARETGNMEQEIRILQAIKRGYKGTGRNKSPAHQSMTGEFFKLNERKLEALIEATTHDMEAAETAVLRMANDQYRKAIFNAQVYANTGAGTYEKSVDMATKDMLSAGLNCIVYANGARHTLSDYANMAIRTASKRAYLQGEGEKRQEWGITTVIMAKRGNPCPKCLPFVGKVLIDDVWSGGSKDGVDPETGKRYPLMSYAVSKGLYHPNCKDSHTTYFPGISTADDTWTKEELEKIGQNYQADQKRQYAVRQVEKFERLAEYSLDGENQRRYKLKVDEWSDRLKQLNGLKPKQSSVNWNEILGITKEQSDGLNDIHTDLNSHMISNMTEKSIVYGLEERKSLFVDIGSELDEVVLSKETIQLLKKSPSNAIIFSHVHPSITSFSRADIDKLVNYKSIKALTVECPEGTKYILDRGSYKSGIFGYHKYDKAFSDAEREAQSLYPEFLSGDLKSLEQIWPEYVDRRNCILAENLGMDYRKVIPDEKGTVED